MKKIILLLAFCLSVGNLFAQDANADKLREEGDAAMTAKNYPEVVAKYSEYLKLTNYEDESRIFNCAFAAYNAKKYDDAIKFYDMAIQKLGTCTFIVNVLMPSSSTTWLFKRAIKQTTLM